MEVIWLQIVDRHSDFHKIGFRVPFNVTLPVDVSILRKCKLLIIQTVQLNCVLRTNLWSRKFHAEHNGVFPKWSKTFIESGEFREYDKSLKHELGLI